MRKKLSAFSLIEISIALLIIGIISASVLNLSKGFYQQYKKQLTIKRQQIVLKALARFAAQYGYLPYPCLPELHHTGLSISSPHVSAPHVSDGAHEQNTWGKINYIGVIPWALLQIPHNTIFDANGNLMTYIMHPLLGERANIQSSALPNRSNTWWRRHSKFCFVRYGEIDLIYNHPNLLSLLYIPPGSSVMNLSPYKPHNPNENSYLADSHETIENPEKLRVRDCIALILISHGTTGGHYDLNGKRTPVTFKPDSPTMDSKAAYNNCQNAQEFDITKPHSLKLLFYLNSSRVGWDQIITYSTRFNLGIYGGPRCEPGFVYEKE